MWEEVELALVAEAGGVDLVADDVDTDPPVDTDPDSDTDPAADPDPPADPDPAVDTDPTELVPPCPPLPQPPMTTAVAATARRDARRDTVRGLGSTTGYEFPEYV